MKKILKKKKAGKLMTSAKEIKEWLDYLPSGLQLLAEIVPDGKPTTVTVTLPGEIGKAVAWVRRNNTNGSNVYFCSNEVNSKLGARTMPHKEHIREVRFSHVDIDPNMADGYKAGRAHLINEVLPELQKQNYLIVDTGNGLAAYATLIKPIKASSAESINRCLIEKYDGDPACWNVNRVMRIPGTLNYANQKKLADGYPAITKAKAYYPQKDKRWNPKKLFESLPKAKSKTVASVKAFKENTTPVEDDELKALLEHLKKDCIKNNKLDGYWTGAVENIDKSAADFGLMSMLNARNYTYREVYALLCEWEHGRIGRDGTDNLHTSEAHYQKEWSRLKSRSDFSDTRKAASKEFTKVARPTVDDITETLERLHKVRKLTDDIWTRNLYNAKLNPSEIDSVLERLAVIKYGSKQPLKNTWTGYKKNSDKFIRRAKSIVIFEQSSDRVSVLNDNDSSTMVPKIINAVVENIKGRGIYKHLGKLSYIDIDCPKDIDFSDSDKNSGVELKIALVKRHDLVSTRALVERYCKFWKLNKDEERVKSVPSDNMIKQVLGLCTHEGSEHTPIPELLRIVSHPIIDMSGHLVDLHGYDAKRKIYFMDEDTTFDPIRICEFDTIEEAHAEATRLYRYIESVMCDGFEYVDYKIDRAAHIGALFTNIEVLVTVKQPGVLINATQASIGKTEMSVGLHVIATGRPMPTHIYSNSSEELEKELFASMRQGAESIVLDNILNGTELKSTSLMTLITGDWLEKRVLGVSETNTVSAAVGVIMNGINITCNEELATRVMTCNITSSASEPDKRKFSVKKDTKYYQKHRANIVKAVLEIIRIYQKAGCPEVDTYKASRFSSGWDQLVKNPIEWITGVDLNKAIDTTKDDSVQITTTNMILNTLSEIYEPGEMIKASDIHFIAKSYSKCFFEDSDRINDLMHKIPNEKRKDVGIRLYDLCIGVAGKDEFPKSAMSLGSTVLARLVDKSHGGYKLKKGQQRSYKLVEMRR